MTVRASYLLGAGQTLIATLFAAAALSLGGPAQSQPPDDCFHRLFNGKEAEIVCRFPTRLTDGERADLKRLTRDMLQDATCLVDIRIDRARVEAALAVGEHIFETPPQPMTCEIATKDSKLKVTGSFSPRIVFKGGLAVEGTPGLANVGGVSKALSLPVVYYVNRSPSVKKNMLQIINAVAAELRKRNGRG